MIIHLLKRELTIVSKAFKNPNKINKAIPNKDSIEIIYLQVKIMKIPSKINIIISNTKIHLSQNQINPQ